MLDVEHTKAAYLNKSLLILYKQTKNQANKYSRITIKKPYTLALLYNKRLLFNKLYNIKKKLGYNYVSVKTKIYNTDFKEYNVYLII